MTCPLGRRTWTPWAQAIRPRGSRASGLSRTRMGQRWVPVLWPTEQKGVVTCPMNSNDSWETFLRWEFFFLVFFCFFFVYFYLLSQCSQNNLYVFYWQKFSYSDKHIVAVNILPNMLLKLKILPVKRNGVNHQCSILFFLFFCLFMYWVKWLCILRYRKVPVNYFRNV
jgi:hypothetical protein